MERDIVKIEEKSTKFEKELFRTREELAETKRYYEERIQLMDAQIRKLQNENNRLLQEQQKSFMTVQNLTKFFNGSSAIKKRAIDSGILGDELESCDVSSLFVNGTSFEEIKEMAANMKLPFIPEKTKANTQVKTTEKLASQKQHANIADFNVNKFMT